MNPHAIAQALANGDLCEYGRLMGRNDYVPPSAVQDNAALLASIAVPVNPHGANAQVDALTMGDLCRRAAPKARREVGPMGGSPDQRTCNVRTTPKPEIDAGRSTPPHPAPAAATQPSQGGGVGSFSEELK